VFWDSRVGPLSLSKNLRFLRYHLLKLFFNARPISNKRLVFDEPLRFDIMVDNCLLLELKAVEALHPFSKAQLFSYMKLLDIPIGLLINFHEPVLKKGISRMILPGANQTEGNEDKEVSF
jgi:hypothetical protein